MIKKKFNWAKVLIISVVSVVSLFVIAGCFLGGSLIWQVYKDSKVVSPTPTPIPTFTGQEVFDAVNNYRTQNGVKELKLDSGLCNHLSQRWLDIKAGEDENVAHKGLDEWTRKYGNPNGRFSKGDEDIATGNTPEEVIQAWAGSPGHRLSILNPDADVACSYALKGTAIIEIGYW